MTTLPQNSWRNWQPIARRYEERQRTGLGLAWVLSH